MAGDTENRDRGKEVKGRRRVCKRGGVMRRWERGKKWGRVELHLAWQG